jgi:hypothetical protein
MDQKVKSDYLIWAVFFFGFLALGLLLFGYYLFHERMSLTFTVTQPMGISFLGMAILMTPSLLMRRYKGKVAFIAMAIPFLIFVFMIGACIVQARGSDSCGPFVLIFVPVVTYLLALVAVGIYLPVILQQRLVVRGAWTKIIYLIILAEIVAGIVGAVVIFNEVQFNRQERQQKLVGFEEMDERDLRQAIDSCQISLVNQARNLGTFCLEDGGAYIAHTSSVIPYPLSADRKTYQTDAGRICQAPSIGSSTEEGALNLECDQALDYLRDYR